MRITNLYGANPIFFRGRQGDAGIALRYFTVHGKPITREVTHDLYSVRVRSGSATTVEVRVHAMHRNSILRCVFRGYGDGGVDQVVLKVRT
jgi:hypothetical protein